MGGRHPDGKNSPVARRCRDVREMFRESQVDFAKRIKVGYQRWNNVENGYPLSKDLARKLTRAVPGLTSDWLDEGHARLLPLHLAQRLSQAAKTRKGSG